jgi:hypothetical protein
MEWISRYPSFHCGRGFPILGFSGIGMTSGIGFVSGLHAAKARAIRSILEGFFMYDILGV